MTNKIEFTFGIGLDRDQRPICLGKRYSALEAIRKAALDWFGGYTLTIGEGGWRDGEGRVFTEENATLTVMVSDVFIVHNLADFIKRRLNQASVLVVTTPCRGEFL